MSSRTLLTVSVLALLLCVARIHGEESEKETQIRAAFLLNFVKFTTWPKESLPADGGPLVIAILGTDPFGRTLEQTFHRQSIQGRATTLKRIHVPDPTNYASADQYEQAWDHVLTEAAQCNVIYMNVPDIARVDSILERLKRPGLMTVGHSRDYAEKGTLLALDRLDEKIVFYANVNAIDESRLDVSSKLLKLARVIEGRGAGTEQ